MKNTIPLTTTAHVEALSHEGRGIAHISGKTIFIEGALPTETVQFEYTRRKSKFDEGRLLNVEKASDARIAPRCAHFGICGGCSLQHLNTELQLEHKQKILLDQLKHFGKVEAAFVHPPLQAQPWGYRRKARLGVRFVEKKNKLLIGFREHNSRFLADIEHCEILDPRIADHFEALRKVLMSFENYRAIPQIEVAGGDDELAIVIRHMEPLTESDHQALIAFGKTQHITVYLQPRGIDSIHKLYPDDGNMSLSYRLPQWQLEYFFHPTDFVQVNAAMNQILVQLAMDLLELNDQDTVLDLFCGLGNFSLPIAQHAKHVLGIEGDPNMVERATKNAAHNQIKNAEFYAADLTQPLSLSISPNKVLIDPPRSGAQEVLPILVGFSPERIVYVSCNPATLARDAGILVHQHGYRLESVRALDMFPHTGHVEAIALFKR